MGTATPIYDRLAVEWAGKEAAAYVRANLLTCPTCKAPVGEPCRSRPSGTYTRTHRGRWLR